MADLIFTSADAKMVVANGRKARKTTITHFIEIPGDCTVRTEEGDILVNEDGYLASDGERVWPVSKDYFDKNYEVIPE